MQGFSGGKVFTTNSPDQTEELGRGLAERLNPGDVVALTGELGSGKTLFVQGIARGLDIRGYTKSPSFTIVNVYEGGRLPLYHIDLYRIGTSGELDGLGLEEYIYGDGVSVIEWADRAMDMLPEETILVKFFYKGETERRIEFEKRDANKDRGLKF
jgi:tRNA threonylcarbamoyladenosine biosynthesis protein TsaE